MEYLFLVIYGFIVLEIFTSNKGSKDEVKNTSYIPRGRSFYFKMAIINIIVGLAGLILFNSFLRDKDIIPDWSLWLGIIGFIIIVIQAIIYVFKAMASNYP